MREEGVPPTNREIGQAMKIASTGHVDYHLSMLEKKNYIQREPRKNRGIKLVQQRPGGIPIMGSIAAGLPIESGLNPNQMLDAGHNLELQNCYALVVNGNSMTGDHICNGDYVVIKPQSSCQNNDIIVAVHFLEENKSNATLKRFFMEQDRVRLQPANSDMDPIYLSKQEWDTEWQVQGKVVAIFRMQTPSVESEKISPPLDTPTSGQAQNAPVPTNEADNASQEEVEKVFELRKLSQTTPIIDTRTEVVIKDSEIPQTPTIVDTSYATAVYSEKREVTYNRIARFNDARSQDLDVIQRMCCEQSERWSRYSLYAAILGFSVILIGVILAIVTVNVSLGFLTALASIMPNVAAVLFFQQSKEANKRLDNLFTQLANKMERSQSIEYALELNNENEKRYSDSIIASLLGQKE